MDLTGYELEPLRDDGEFALYRARQPGNPVPVLARVAGRASGSTAHLEHEYALAAVLDPGWAARPMALSRHQGTTTLLLEDNGGEPLDRALGRPLELTRFLHLAINLAIALGEVHRHGLIHKNIKPANLLVDAAGNVRLTGFGLASRLPRERQEPVPPETIAGTFAYMPPEQTGRMNRSIDARSDLYSLGVTLYEMLTGALPFIAADPMEWIHSHIARRPPPPSERVGGIPGAVEAIVLKLLAKTAEDRYQTAAGVAADLRACLTEWEKTGSIEAFPLGVHDVPDVLRIPEKLYGREEQVGSLLAAFDRVVSCGTTELILVSGYSGIGKSSVVSELHKAIVPPRGLFAEGKFDRYKRDIPYATLAQAFQSLVRYILAKSDLEVSQWRDDLREALGRNGQLMVNLVPELALIIGQQPPVPDLPPQDQQARFQLVFRRFLGVFARPEHPLALFLDDLQWLDAATLELVEHLVTQPEVHHLLLVGAYRDNEVASSHPLMRTLDAIRKAGGPVREVALGPLVPGDIERLVADAVNAQGDRVRPLAELVLEKTAGNPFFVIQFLTALSEEKLLNFDPSIGAWTADVERIRAKGYTDNVVDLMVGKLVRLPDETQRALTQLACLGNLAEVATLSLIQGQPVDTIHVSLWEAVQAGLVFRSQDTYRFLHDRVQEAAYSLIPQESRAEMHLRIGRMLASRMSPAEIAEQIFDVVNQLNHGSALLVSREEREHVAELNLMAGRRAKAATAYAAALRYFSAGRALLAPNGWELRYQLMFELELNWAEGEYLTGELAIAEERLSELSARAKTTMDLAAVTCVRINLYTNLDRSDSAVEVGLDYLRRVDDQWPAHATADHVRLEYDHLWQRVGPTPIEALLDLPVMSDPDRCATMDVLTVLTSPALFTDLNLFRLVVGRMASLSMEHGNSDGSCLAYAWLGGILGTYFGDYQAGFRFGRIGLDLVEKRGFDRLRARVYLVFAVHVAHWTQYLPACRDLLKRAFEAAQEAGDLTYAAYSRADLITNLLASGDPLAEVEQEAKGALQYVRKVRFGLIGDIIAAQLILIKILRGPTSGSSCLNDADFDEGRFMERLESNPRLAVAASRYWIRKLQAYVHAGDYVSAVATASKVAPLLWTVPTQPELSEYHFYGALAWAARSSMVSAEERPQHLEALAAHRQQIAIWAENGPATFANRLAMVDAEIARLEGRELDAERLYEEAIRLAREQGFIQHEALGNELAARFHATRGIATIAGAYLTNARSCYLRWGAEGKVRQLDRAYAHLRKEPSRPDSTVDTSIERLDLATVVKASQAVSTEIDLNELIHTLMVLALEHSGGDRGLLILLRSDEFRLEAEATTVRDTVEVRLLQTEIAPTELPESVLRYVIRTQDSVLLDDASEENPYSADEYLRRKRCRSVLCLPLVKQASLIGVLYLENNLTPQAFTPAQIAVLRLLASQAAISLDNARLYAGLRHVEANLAEAQRLSHTGSFGWNVSSGEIFWPEESFRIFGYDPATKPSVEMVLNRVHPDDVALVRQVIDRAANDKQDFDFEHRLLLPDGSVKHLHVVAHPVTDESGKLQFVGALMDITARKKAEAALRHSEQRYRHLFHHMPVALLQINVRARIELIKGLCAEGVTDLGAYLDQHPGFLRRAMDACVVEEVNERAIEMFGARDASELYGSTAPLWRESPATFRRALESRFRGESTFQEEARFATLDGRLIDALVTIARPDVISDLGINLLGLVNVTERIRAEERLQQVQAEFARAARISVLGELAASIAHEVNQPLAAMTTNGEAGLRWLNRPEPNVANARESVQRIVEDAHRAADIISRIRALAAGRTPRRTTLSLHDVIDDSLMFLRHELQSKGISVSLDLAPALSQVIGDRTQLQQLIVNLAINAAQAMEHSGTKRRILAIRTMVSDSVTLRCMLEDSGPGIEPDHLDQLFDSFFTTKESGMGMGLPICRSIIEAHGGRITADNESALGGARICFTLPAAGAIC